MRPQRNFFMNKISCKSAKAKTSCKSVCYQTKVHKKVQKHPAKALFLSKISFLELYV